MTFKHLIYRFKFRDNMNRFPTLRLALLTAALDLDKIAMVRQRNGLDSVLIETLIERLKTHVGM
jgi:hypothetical protein